MEEIHREWEGAIDLPSAMSANSQVRTDHVYVFGEIGYALTIKFVDVPVPCLCITGGGGNPAVSLRYDRAAQVGRHVPPQEFGQVLRQVERLAAVVFYTRVGDRSIATAVHREHTLILIAERSRHDLRNCNIGAGPSFLLLYSTEITIIDIDRCVIISAIH